MVDVNRIRERAADWLGDMGDAAIDFVSRVFQWRHYRSTGDVWSISQRTIGLAPSLRWVFTGSGERRVGPDIGEAFARGVRKAEEAIWRYDDSDDELRARIKAALARGEPCPGPHQDFEPCDLCAGPVDMQRTQDEIAEVAGCVRSVEPSPWRGVEHTVHESRLGSASWIVGPDSGPVMVASFSGLHAEARAREYAALMSAPLPCTAVLLVGQDNAADNGVWCDRHGGRLADAAPDVDPAEPTINQKRAALDLPPLDGGDVTLGRYVNARAKPAAVALCHRWSCVGVEGELEVCELRQALAGFSGDVGLRPLGSVGPATVRAREADMLGLKEWRFLG